MLLWAAVQAQELGQSKVFNCCLQAMLSVKEGIAGDQATRLVVIRLGAPLGSTEVVQ